MPPGGSRAQCLLPFSRFRRLCLSPGPWPSCVFKARARHLQASFSSDSDPPASSADPRGHVGSPAGPGSGPIHMHSLGGLGWRPVGTLMWQPQYLRQVGPGWLQKQEQEVAGDNPCTDSAGETAHRDTGLLQRGRADAPAQSTTQSPSQLLTGAGAAQALLASGYGHVPIKLSLQDTA